MTRVVAGAILLAAAWPAWLQDHFEQGEEEQRQARSPPWYCRSHPLSREDARDCSRWVLQEERGR